MFNSFPFIKPYQRVGVANGSSPISVVVEFTIMKARDITLSKFGLLAYSKMHFIVIVPDKFSPQKCLDFSPKPKQCFHAVLAPFLNNHPLIYASPAIDPEICTVDAGIAIYGSPLAIPTTSVTTRVNYKRKTRQQLLGPREKCFVRTQWLTYYRQT